MISTIPIRIILAFMVMVLVGGILIFGPAACQKIRSQGQQNKVNVGQSKALGETAVDAVQTQGNVMDNAMASEETTRKNAEEIDNAEGSTAPVHTDVHNAGLRSICARPSAAKSERCRVFNASRP